MGADQAVEVNAETQQACQRVSSGAQAQRSNPSALVICGPSGVGKGTLIEKLLERPDRFGFSCSHTTRTPRSGEQEGIHYHFTSKAKFQKMIAEGKFLEHAAVHDNLYGTSLAAVEAMVKRQKCCLLDIDVQGARKVRESKQRAIYVFIKPPSMELLKKRLEGRGSETEQQIQRRSAAASKEMARCTASPGACGTSAASGAAACTLTITDEPGLFDFVIVNNDLDTATMHLAEVAERALAGQTGNGTNELTVYLGAEAPPQEWLALHGQPNQLSRTQEQQQRVGAAA